MDFRKPYVQSDRVYAKVEGESLTEQAPKNECDINNILKKYKVSGLVEHVNKYEGKYGDFSDAKSYQEAMNLVIKGEEAFMSLPANVRVKFNNDPVEFLDFVGNPANKEEMINLGLARKTGDEMQKTSVSESSVSTEKVAS